MTSNEETDRELEKKTSESKSVVIENEEVSEFDNKDSRQIVEKVNVSQEDSEQASSKGVLNEAVSSPLTAESTSNAEDEVEMDNTTVLGQGADKFEHSPKDTEQISVEFESNDITSAKVNDDGDVLYTEDELNIEVNASEYQSSEYATDSTVSGPEAIEKLSLVTSLADTETDRIPGQVTEKKGENLYLGIDKSILSTDLVRDVDTTEFGQDEDLDDGQNSDATEERKEYDTDFIETVTAEDGSTVQFDNGLDNQRSFSEVVPVLVEHTSSHKQITSCLKTGKVSSRKQKVKKSVSVTDVVCEENESELSSIVMGTLDLPRTADAPVVFTHNVLEAYLSKYANGTQETADADPIRTVRFKLGGGKMFAGAYEGSCTIKDVKIKLARLFEIDYEIITLKQNGCDVSDWLTLSILCTEDLKYLDLELSSRDSSVAMTAEFVSKFIPTFEVIIVHCHLGENVYQDIIVEIENQSLRKEWLGGYRNTNKNLVYHHAATQTLPKERRVFEKTEGGDFVPILYERQTQTPFPVKNIAVDTPVNKATQMSRPDYYVSCAGDKIMTAKNFATYEEWLEKNDVIKKVVTIQRAVKHWIKNKTFEKFYEAQRMAVKMFRDEKIKILTEQAERKRRIISGAALPTSRDDFYMLYLMVGRWWKKEWQRIKDIRSDESRKAEYVALLEREIELLSAIEKQRITVKGESLRKEKMRFLEVTSRPTVFRNERGVMTSMDRVDTQIARTHKDTYCTLIRTDLTPQERTDFLLNLRNQLIKYCNDYEFFSELISLIEREIDFLATGMEAKALTGLRKRIELFYLDLVRKPKYNPKAPSYRKAKWPKTVDTLYHCVRCQKLLPVCDFPVHTRLLKILVCTSCEWLQNIGHQRLDMSPYLKLLRQVQNIEMQKCCYTSLCFLLQQIGMYFLTRIIWHGHSAISETRNLAKLCMVRWNNREEWTPWNTILLTEQEAEFHASIDDVEQFYSPAFISSVHQKHILARIHFFPLLKTDHALRSTGAWQNITDSGVYIHPTHIKQHFQDEMCDIPN